MSDVLEDIDEVLRRVTPHPDYGTVPIWAAVMKECKAEIQRLRGGWISVEEFFCLYPYGEQLCFICLQDNGIEIAKSTYEREFNLLSEYDGFTSYPSNQVVKVAPLETPQEPK